jgi:hypothetical protein
MSYFPPKMFNMGWSHKSFFLVILHTIFCKLGHFINVNNSCLSVVKRPSLQQRVSKFMSKKFYEIITCVLQNITESILQVILEKIW